MQRQRLLGPVMRPAMTGLDGSVISTNAVPLERPMIAYSRPDGLT
jgi:hypothetical protein